MKRTLYLVSSFVYLAILFFSLIVLMKPGYAIFYQKSQIQDQSLVRAGDIYEFHYMFNGHVYNPDTILIFEDQKRLSSVSRSYLESYGNGNFALKDFTGEQVTIQFVPTNFSDPVTNGHVYWIYIRPYFISSNLGGMSFLLLLTGLISFLSVILANPEKRKRLLGAHFWIRERGESQFEQATGKSTHLAIPRSKLIKKSINNITLIAYFYVFMEWIFFITKPSFMELLSLGEKIKIMLITGFAVTFLGLLTLLVIFLMDIILTPVAPTFRNYAYQMPFAFLTTCLCLILVDNFTYTVLKFGIVDTKTLLRVLYALLTSVLFVLVLRKMGTIVKPKSAPNFYRIQSIFVVILIAVSLVLIGLSFNPLERGLAQDNRIGSLQTKPNVILLGTDGLNAENMSVYGYKQKTTPFIAELAKTSLVGENNFSNAGTSTGSDTSLLTGKLPFATHVLYPPNTLMGIDMYQHLPGLLKNQGYRTISIGVPYFVDVNNINFRYAFDAVNCKEKIIDNPSSRLSEYGYDKEIYFLNTIRNRIVDRLSHMFFLKDMQNPYLLVTQIMTASITDEQRLDCLRSYLAEVSQTGQPLFAHIHLMATHGPMFDPRTRYFSKGENQDQFWMTDFYNDAILNYDNEVQQLTRYLQEHDLYQNTILLLFSDHGQMFNTTNKLPLIIHFPNDQYTGKVTDITQNMDIAPTILDYLGIPIPVWMEGSSLLGNLDPYRLIIAGLTQEKTISSGFITLSEEAFKPPFYQFDQLSVIQCQNWFLFNLNDMTVSEGEVVDYINPCQSDKLDSFEVIREKVGGILTRFGYQLPGNW